MPRCHPLPIVWLMTDERADVGLETALARLPRGGGVIFRHHATPPAARRARYEAVRRLCRARRLLLLVAGAPRLAVAWRADGVHGRSPHRVAARPLVRTRGAHGRRELVAALAAGADRVLLSPVFATRSHPGARPLGPVRFGLAARPGRGIVALGGMSARRFRRLLPLGAEGWAAIDAWSDDGQQSVRNGVRLAATIARPPSSVS